MAGFATELREWRVGDFSCGAFGVIGTLVGHASAGQIVDIHGNTGNQKNMWKADVRFRSKQSLTESVKNWEGAVQLRTLCTMFV